MQTKTIICRFRNESDLLEFRARTGLKVDPTINEFIVSTGTKTRKKIIAKVKAPNLNAPHIKEWKQMPEYKSKEVKAYLTVNFVFDEDNYYKASEIFDQKMTDLTKSVWYPKVQVGNYIKKRLVGGDSNTRYPIYVVSKGRAEKCYTSRYLAQMEVPHYIVVEPSEVDLYVQHNFSKYVKILEMDMSFKRDYLTMDDLGDTKSKGAGAARNFAWDHSISCGHRRHWVMDDNCDEGFYYLNRNEKIRARTGALFRACEDFVDRYENVPLAGLNYSKFCKMTDHMPAFIMNTRIYSFLLIDNTLPMRWRGRYNEDTDLSLRVLKSGSCTIQFNFLLAGKATTQRIKGGNTDEFYDKEGTLPKSKMLEQMHPDVAKVVWKFSRWHHEVDYSGFRQKLKLRPEFQDLEKSNDNYGTQVIVTEEIGYSDVKSYLEDKYKDQITIK